MIENVKRGCQVLASDPFSATGNPIIDRRAVFQELCKREDRAAVRQRKTTVNEVRCKQRGRRNSTAIATIIVHMIKCTRIRFLDKALRILVNSPDITYDALR
jgi:hypothetical protein